MTDPFETVAIAHSQPQAAVMLSFLEWHGIPAYAMNIETIRTLPDNLLALGGIPIRVMRDRAGEAHDLLGEVADAPEPDRVTSGRVRTGRILRALTFGWFGVGVPPRLAATLLDRESRAGGAPDMGAATQGEVA